MYGEGVGKLYQETICRVWVDVCSVGSMSGGCMGTVWMVCGGCLECVGSLSGGCVKVVWRVQGGYLEVVGRLSGGCGEAV